MKTQHRLFLLILVIICSCLDVISKEQSNSIITADSAREINKIESIESVVSDLNFDGKRDTIFLTTPPSSYDPGEFNKVIISLAGIGRQEFTGKDVWDQIDSTFLSNNHNAVQSKRVFVYKEKNSTILLLFGYLFGTGREFAILRVDGSRVQMIFDQDLDEIIKIGNIDNEGQTSLIGRNSYEFYIEVDSLDADIGTYSPFLIYTIGKTVSVNEVLSKKYNEQNYVWAGLKYNENLKILYPRKGGKPRIIVEEMDK